MTQQRARLEQEMARLFAKGAKFLIIDTETSGLPWKDKNAQVIEVSCVNQDGLVVFQSLVKPDVSVPLSATMIHGLRDADLAKAPTFAEIWPGLLKVLESVEVLYAYNATFDRDLLLSTAQRFKVAVPEHIARQQWFCLMEAYAEYHGDWNEYHQSYTCKKLSVACGRLGASMSEAHRATGDALSTLALMKALAVRGATTVPTT